MSLAKKLLNHTEGFNFLTVAEEKKEALAIGRMPLKLQYLKKSKQLMGMSLWNVLTPVPGYKTGPDCGYPTFSLDSLIRLGLI